MTEQPSSATTVILVVDDKESNRYVLATWLRRAGYGVVEAASGEEAMAAIAAQPIDLVVLDVNLPDMTGYVVCERIKERPASSSVPVLHVSATATEPSDRSEGLRRGAEGYLIEPLEREELLATVEALLRGASAQQTALRLARRLRQLNEATLAIYEAATLEVLIETIAREARSLFEASAAVRVVFGDKIYSAAFSASGDGVPDVALDAITSPDPRYATVQLDDRGNGYRGILLVEKPDDDNEQIDDETEVVLKQYARAASTAINNMHLYNLEHRIALTLQRSLLPERMPAIAGIEVAVRYEPSTEHAQVGGDFYEVFSLGDDRIVFAIGDVAGHSLEAATVMAQLRTGLRSYTLEGRSPMETLQQLNRLLRRFHPYDSATVCCAVYDIRTGECEFANAGHPSPLVVGREGVYFLPVGGTLLGIDAPVGRVHTFTLEPGDVLVLFTDGLVERRYEPMDVSLQRLASVAAERTNSLDELCDRLLRQAGPENVTDDIAIVAIRRPG
ncbi:MAG TPA: SpoIIE family protein phosphatase [Candidatus Baltobacteraceae bacterium]